MQPVQAPARRLTRSRAVWLAAGVAALVLCVVIAVSGSGDSSPAAASVKSDLALIGGKPLQQASCEDWISGTPDERAAVVATIKRSVGGATPYGPGATLTADQAYALFARTCAPAYARGFLLYSIYAKAAAFQRTPEHFQ
jgi:hypothetical protein